MEGWRRSAEDPRTTEELFRVALAELDLENDGSGPTSGALSALHLRPTREVLAHAIELCRSPAVADPLCHRRRLGVTILAELSETPETFPPTGQPAFVQESMQVLLELADTEQDIDVLEDVARAFGYRQDPRGVPPLLRWRDHADQRMRFFVASSLPYCAGPHDGHSIRALVKLTDDENGAVRDYALLGLRMLEADGPEVRDAMLRRVRDEDTSAAGEALAGLAALGDERGIDPLNEYLQDPSVPAHHVRSYGLEAATTYADLRLLPALQILKADGNDAPDLADAIRACSANTTSQEHSG